MIFNFLLLPIVFGLVSSANHGCSPKMEKTFNTTIYSLEQIAQGPRVIFEKLCAKSRLQSCGRDVFAHIEIQHKSGLMDLTTYYNFLCSVQECEDNDWNQQNIAENMEALQGDFVEFVQEVCFGAVDEKKCLNVGKNAASMIPLVVKAGAKDLYKDCAMFSHPKKSHHIW